MTDADGMTMAERLKRKLGAAAPSSTDTELAFAALLDIERHVKKMGGIIANLTTAGADFRTSVTKLGENPLVTVNIMFTPSALRGYIAQQPWCISGKRG
jgi:hypothetical protein